MEEKRTAFGRTPTDKAWQELKRHRQEIQNDSTRIIDEIGRLEGEVAALQARLEEERFDRSVQQKVTAVLEEVVADEGLADETPASAVNQPGSENEAELTVFNPEQSEAFDIFFATQDGDREKDRRFLLD